MRHRIAVLILIQLYSLDLFGQTGLPELLNSLFKRGGIIEKKIKTSELAISIIKNDSVKFTFKSSPLIPRTIQGDFINDDQIRLDPKSFKKFEFKQDAFIYYSISKENCLGSFCRASVSYLIQENADLPRLFKIVLKETPDGFYFGDINGDNNLDAIEIQHSFTAPEAFTTDELSLINLSKNEIMYRIYAISLQKGKWERLKKNNIEYSLLVIAQNYSNQCRIVKKFWPN